MVNEFQYKRILKKIYTSQKIRKITLIMLTTTKSLNAVFIYIVNIFTVFYIGIIITHVLGIVVATLINSTKIGDWYI